jgi:hypothetical protein
MYQYVNGVLNHQYTGWFKALVQYLRMLLGRWFGTEKYKHFFHIHHRFVVTIFNVYVAFIVVIFEFYEMEIICFTIKFQLILLIQRQKSNFGLSNIFRSSLQGTSFWVGYFLFVCWGLVSGLNVLYITTTAVRSVPLRLNTRLWVTSNWAPNEN